MICHTNDVVLIHHYERPAKCAACPFFQRDPECYRKVDSLGADVVYTLDDGRTATVKAGFCTDGASIPKAVWNIVGQPYEADFLRAAILHDVLYHADLMPKREVDLAFLGLLDYDGVVWWKRNAMYRAVAMFGGPSYDLAPEITAHFKQFIEIK